MLARTVLRTRRPWSQACRLRTVRLILRVCRQVTHHQPSRFFQAPTEGLAGWSLSPSDSPTVSPPSIPISPVPPTFHVHLPSLSTESQNQIAELMERISVLEQQNRNLTESLRDIKSAPKQIDSESTTSTTTTTSTTSTTTESPTVHELYNIKWLYKFMFRSVGCTSFHLHTFESYLK